MSIDIEGILKNHKLKLTPFRIKVLEIFNENPEIALSSSTIEEQLEKFDRITLYRTLKSFEESGVIHQVIDGTNATKFALCSHGCTKESHNDDHAHFRCEKCGDTTCLEYVLLEKLKLPPNYSLDKIHLALSGTCSKCN